MKKLTVSAMSLALASFAFSGAAVSTTAVAAEKVCDGPKVNWRLSLWGKRRAFTEGLDESFGVGVEAPLHVLADEVHLLVGLHLFDERFFGFADVPFLMIGATHEFEVSVIAPSTEIAGAE